MLGGYRIGRSDGAVEFTAGHGSSPWKFSGMVQAKYPQNCRKAIISLLPYYRGRSVDHVHMMIAIPPKYAVSQVVGYIEFLDHAEIELSNNLAENSMRPVALGRRNWIHVGSVDAGPRVAAILSVVETCRRLGVPVREYLADVLPGLADRKASQVADLTPMAWKLHRQG